MRPSVRLSVRPSVRPSVPLQISVGCVLCVKGMTICNTNEFVQSRFSDGLLIVRYINKMGTDGGGGGVDGIHCHFKCVCLCNEEEKENTCELSV